MTEEEARTKWCPQSTGNPTTKSFACCIASDCMAWRWITHELDEVIWKPTGPNTAESTEQHTGYCGLAEGTRRPSPYLR